MTNRRAETGSDRATAPGDDHAASATAWFAGRGILSPWRSVDAHRLALRRVLRHLPGWQVGLAGLAALAVLAVLFVTLARQVSADLDRLGTSRTDNAYWTLTQLEVEFLELGATLTRIAVDPQAPLDALRGRYDIVFSRLTTLDESPFYRVALDSAGSLPQADRMADALRQLAPVMDGPDPALRAALPDISRLLDAWRPTMRAIAVESNLLLARTSAEGRARVAGTLLRLAVVTLALLAVLATVAVGFFRLSQISRHQARDVRRASERLAAIIGTAPDGLIVTDGDGRIEQANAAASQLLGLSMADLVNAPVGRFLRLRDRDAALTLPPPGLGPLRYQVMARRAGGTEFPGELAIARAEGAAIAVLFLRDVSDRVATEDTLRRARDQAMAGERAKAHFIAVMSHEMRTPLHAILGLSELLADAPLPADQQDQVALLGQSGRVLLQHVNDVLDIARLEARGADLVARPFDLGAMVRDLIDSLQPEAAARGNRLVLDIAADAGGVFQGDAARLRQVLTNLLTNAVKYTRDGTVTLMVAALSGPQAWVEFQVADTGIGIAADRSADIFEDFVRLTPPDWTEEGTGLGLGIVRRLVTAMGGEIGVESEPGEGSLFWVRLPLAHALPVAPETPAPVLAPTGPLKVLMAEDHPVNRLVLRRLLERDGHVVDEVGDGAAAVQAAQAVAYDMILMDIGMPVMDGLAATAAIRVAPGASRAARIVAVTAHAFADDHARFLTAGFDAVIVKPVSATALRHALVDGGVTQANQVSGATMAGAALKDLIGEAAATRALQGLVTEARALARTLRAGDAAPEALHRLAGLAGTCGAQSLAALLADGERALRACAPWDVAPLLAEIDAVIAEVG